MRKQFMAGVAAIAAMSALPSSARADFNDTMCINSADVCVKAAFVLSGTNSIEVYLFNGVGVDAAGSESVLTGFGIDLPSAVAGTWSLGGVSYVNNGVATNVLGGWSFQTGGGLNSIGMSLDAGAGAGGSSGISTCDGPTGGGTKYRTCEGNGTFSGANDWVKFTFNKTGAAMTQAQINALNWGYKVQAVEGIGGGSLECSSNASLAKYCGDDVPGTSTEIVTPEPATMTLIATGLAGMAAARRRKK